MSNGGQKSAVLVPIKAFNQAKSRLDSTLNGQERAQLAKAMASAVLAAASPLPCFVVCGDPEVATWAKKHGAELLWHEPGGLNQAVTFATQKLAEAGFQRVIIAHGDLPLATDLGWLADVGDMVLVTDRHGTGTNVLSIPTSTSFRFSYGPDSASAHRAEASRIGLEWVVVQHHQLSWDIDEPADLAALPDGHPLSTTTTTA